MDSLIKVNRFVFKPDWTIGKVLVNNILDGYSVEDELRDVKIKGETAVDNGTYPLSTRQSPKFSASFLWSDSLKKLIEAKEKPKYISTTDWKPHDLIWIKDTPRHELCLIHWGNTDDDTEGCLVVGGSMGVINGQEGVTGSKIYYKKLYEKVYPTIKNGGQFITYQIESLNA